ncbi:hypothetical protein [Variovorax sp. PAMC 28711]|uniref:hypothetical protein n=1 Tax=Variovorax sp. PAMC 28711 TaxID=1795631 RepID=UPI00078ECDA2|nr:hypothetical protein [Variovorax sp. PAMC 28711]AMM22997.1 hypothetical protein AX767_00330 [Variovorax sp. PAMC 28711]
MLLLLFAGLGGVVPPTPDPGAGPVVEFTIGGAPRYRRDPNHIPILQRALAAKADRFVKPAHDRAQRRAKAIEVEAAELVLEQPEAAEQSFAQLVDRWLAERPVMPAATDPSQQFLAQIALRIQQINAQAEAAELMRRMRDESDVLALLLL